MSIHLLSPKRFHLRMVQIGVVVVAVLGKTWLLGTVKEFCHFSGGKIINFLKVCL
jgi:hypothetical protein